MDLYYYINQINEELDGAAEYVEKAINCKKIKPERSATFSKMSDMELEHASSLLKMFEEDYKECQTNGPLPSMCEDTRRSILDNYAERTAKIKYRKQLYIQQ